MHVNLHEVLARLGLTGSGALPFCVRCPICKANQTLQIRGSDDVLCERCHFLGDAIQLYGKVMRLNIRDAVAQLDAEDLIQWGDRETTNQYIEEFEEQERIQTTLQEGRQLLLSNPSPLSAILRDQLKCTYTMASLEVMAPHVSMMTRKDLDDAGIQIQKRYSRDVSDWGQYQALLIPTYHNWRVTGAYVITPMMTGFMSLSLRAARPGYAFRRIPPAGKNQQVFICNDIGVATRYLFRQALDQTELVPILVPENLQDHDSPADFPCANQLIYWNYGNAPAAWYSRAIKCSSGAFLIPEWIDDPNTENPRAGWPDLQSSGTRLMANLTRLAQPATQVVGRWLLERIKNPVVARRYASALSLSCDAVARCLSYFNDQDIDRLNDIFDFQQSQRRIELNGTTIVEDGDGWRAGDKQICNAILRVETICHDSKQDIDTVSGTITFKGNGARRAYAFEATYAEIRNNTARWLERRLIAERAGVPIIARAWAGEIWNIAMKMHPPVIRDSVAQYGWTAGTLRIASFAVDSSGVTNTSIRVEGPQVPRPVPLTPPEYDNFKHLGFCKLGLILLGNLVKTSQGEKPLGIALLQGQHRIDQIAEVMGAQVHRNPEDQVLQRFAMSPLPLFTSWSDGRLAEVMRQREYPNNFMLSMNRLNYIRLSAQPGWIRAHIDDGLCDYAALRWIFYALPVVLRGRASGWNDDHFFADLAKLAATWLPEGQQSLLTSAASKLDFEGRFTDYSQTFHTVGLLVAATDESVAKPTILDDTITISLPAVRRYLQSLVIPTLRLDALLDNLVDKKLVLARNKDAVTMDLHAWNMYASTWRSQPHAQVKIDPPAGLAAPEPVAGNPPGGIPAQENPPGGLQPQNHPLEPPTGGTLK